MGVGKVVVVKFESAELSQCLSGFPNKPEYKELC